MIARKAEEPVGEGGLWSRFNGTAHLIARKVDLGGRLTDLSSRLQWDRAFDSAEGRPTFDAAVVYATGLQWDRAFDSAEGRRNAPATNRNYLLQWDRAFDSAEGLVSPNAYATFNAKLQWDRAFDSAEGDIGDAGTDFRSLASMGPRI